MILNRIHTSTDIRLRFSSQEKFLLLMVLSYTVVCCLAAYNSGILARINFLLYAEALSSTAPTILCVFIIYLCFKILWWKVTIKPRPLFETWWPMLLKRISIKGRFRKALPTFIALFIFLSLFSNMKGLISYYGEYKWDSLFAEWDKIIHFGIDPWRLLHPLLGYTYITLALNFIYNIWLPLMIFFLYWQLLSVKQPELRQQFFCTFIFVWGINGTLMAILFASGGPCYYEFMVGESYYAELMSYLNTVNEQHTVWALTAQEMLLELFKKDRIMIGVGISAMPSMYVATAFLYYLLTHRINQVIGRIFGIYFILIFLGSIHLAWHYAIDGYVSIISTFLYWKASGYIVKWFESKPDSDSIAC